MRTVHTDCRHYRGDRPCAPHKQEGVICDDCRHFDPIQERLLIVKLAAMGDVLRTTALLPALRERFPHAHVTWVTAAESASLLARNPYLDRVLLPDAATVALLMQERFERVVCLDLDPQATALAALARCARRDGFVRDEHGAVVPGGPAAEQWYEMSLWDDQKKGNTATYQQHVFRMLGLQHAGEEPVLVLDEAEREAARARTAAMVRPLVGLNLGGGGRWRYKRWTVDGFVALAERLHRERGATPVLLYGPPEQPIADEVARRLSVPYGDGRSDNPVRAFAALVGACDLLVTGDTLAMHLAIAQRVPTVVLFGPTSAAEIELYGRGAKIVADIPCRCCYLPDCTVRPTCMDRIFVDTVLEACLNWLS